MTGYLRRFIIVSTMAAIALVGGTRSASNAAADDNAKLSNVIRASDGSVTGTLTVRSGQSTVVVDAGSLIISLGGKDFPVASQPGASADRSTILLIDRSGSMREQGMAVVRSSVDRFLQLAPKDVKIGVVSFADQAEVNLPPTTDHSAVQAAVAGLKSDGDTALYNAVAKAVETLGTTGDRSIVLLSDGKDTITPTGGSATEQLLRSSGVRAEVIAFKTTDTDNLALGYLAAAGQGKVVEVSNSAGVSDAFTAAAKALDSQISWSMKPTGMTGAQDLQMRGMAGGAAFTATGSVDLGSVASAIPSASSATPVVPVVVVPPASAAAPSDVSTGGFMSQTVAGIPAPVGVAALLLFVAILLAVMALMSPAFKSARRERVEAIEQYVNQTTRRTPGAVRTTNVTGIAESLVQMGDRAVQGRESTAKTVLLLQRADLPWRAGEWAVLRVIAIVVGGLLGIFLLHDGAVQVILGLILGVFVGVMAPPLVLNFLARRRSKKFERQLPDVLTLVASSLSTGFSLPQALDAVAHDVDQPAAKEFARAMAETRIGSDIEDSLDRMATRMDSTNMTWATMAIGIQRRVGGNLAETLRQTATTLREREALFRHVRALSAEGRLSSWILIALPIGLLIWMLFVNVEYISLLWRSLIGIAMSVMAIILMTIGVFWMRKVVEVEV